MKKDVMEKEVLTTEGVEAEKSLEKKVDMDELIEKGKKGDLSTSDLDEAMENMEFDMDSLEKLYEAFEDNGVSLPDDISTSEMNEIESEVERFGGGENMERLLEQEGLSIDDPVRMYLKEIGKVPLLTAEREKELAERMAAGDDTAKTELVEANLRLVVTTGDGILTSIKLMEVMMKKKMKLGELCKELTIYPQVLKNVRVVDKAAAQNDPDVQQAVRDAAEALGDSGRILVRESGTEPVIRVMVEAATEDACHRHVDAVVDIICQKGHARV